MQHVVSTESEIQCLLVADSRANSFDNYEQPTDIKVHYIIRRGANIKQLLDETLQYLTSHDIPKLYFVKIAAGINDLLDKVSGALIPSQLSVDSFILKLIDFRKAVKFICPFALVGFVTIPTVYFQGHKSYCESQGQLLYHGISEKVLNANQVAINEKIQIINSRIRHENSKQQLGHVAGCWTVSWHQSIVKDIKKRRGKSRRLVSAIRYSYDSLYDGLHAKSTVKKYWFSLLVHCFRSDIEYTVNENQTGSCESYASMVESENNLQEIGSNELLVSSQDSEVSETDQCWKRKKTLM